MTNPQEFRPTYHKWKSSSQYKNDFFSTVDTSPPLKELKVVRKASVPIMKQRSQDTDPLNICP